MTDRLPEAFVQRVEGQLREELPFFLQALEAPAVRGLRMNTLRPGWETPFRDGISRVPWARSGWEIPLASEAGTTLAHEAGAFYLQDPAAMLPAEVMDARPGERILDLCAAPGGKATRMGEGLAGEGLLICNDPVASRAAVLSRNLERMGIPNAIVTRAFPDQLAKKWPECFDGVMVDAPCSGEGMFGRHPETRQEWSPEKAQGCALRQREILDAAARMVRPGGRLVYGTCTWNPAENEHQVQDFLTRHPDFTLAPFSLPGAEGKEGMFTCWPHRTRGGGQFVALLLRQGDERRLLPEGKATFRLPEEALRAWKEMGLSGIRPNALFGQTIVSLPEIPDLKGIPVLRLGLHLGQMKGKICQPDHAAAMAFRSPDAPEVELNDEEALRFLAGEALPREERGWVRLRWRGLPLGWGKGSDGMLRNHYPKGLRNQKIIL